MSRWLYRLLVLLIGLLLLVLNAGLYFPAAGDYGTAAIPASAVAQLNFIGEALGSGPGGDMQGSFLEGYSFSHVLFGLSLVQVGLRAAGDLRDEALREARCALELLDSDGHLTFSPILEPS